MTRSLANQWAARYQKNRSAYEELLTWDPYREWETLVMVESRVEQELLTGLEVAYAIGLTGIALSFFHRASEVAQRAIDEDRLTSPQSKDRFPKNRAVLYRAHSYARVLMGQRLDTLALETSIDDLVVWCRGHESGKWDSQAQANYLAAVRIALLLGDVARAAELVKLKKSCKRHSEEHSLWKRIVQTGDAAGSDQRLVESLSGYLEVVSDPLFVPRVYTETEILRLEVAAINDRFVSGAGASISWSRAVGSIADEIE